MRLYHCLLCDAEAVVKTSFHHLKKPKCTIALISRSVVSGLLLGVRLLFVTKNRQMLCSILENTTVTLHLPPYLFSCPPVNHILEIGTQCYVIMVCLHHTFRRFQFHLSLEKWFAEADCMPFRWWSTCWFQVTCIMIWTAVCVEVELQNDL